MMTHRIRRRLFVCGALPVLAAALALFIVLPAVPLSAPSAVYGDTNDNHDGEHGDAHDDDHEADRDETIVELNDDKLAILKLDTVKVRRGTLTQVLQLPGEVQWNTDRVAHVVPRVSGVVRHVYKGLGDMVQEGEVLAELDSGELASAKAAYLAAHAREQLAQANFEREQRLWEQKITAERDYLEAKSALAEARIEKRLAELQMYAIGIAEETVKNLPQAPDSELTAYRMISPLTGVVVDRHIVRGEMLTTDSQAYMIVDPSTVWVIGRAYERDLRLLSTGQTAAIRVDAYPNEPFEGTVDYISRQLDLETRTVEVRVVLDNPSGRLRAGMFGEMTVFAEVYSSRGEHTEGLLVPREAVQRMENGFVVFRQVAPGRFRMVPVQIRDKSRTYALVVGELRVGDEVVMGDTFLLKSEAARGKMGEGHSH